MNLNLRASDADRERIVAELGDHAAAGRLTLDEFDQRTQTAYAAATIGELEALTTDLPPLGGNTPTGRHIPSAVLYGLTALVVVLAVVAMLGMTLGPAMADSMNGMTGMRGMTGGCR